MKTILFIISMFCIINWSAASGDTVRIKKNDPVLTAMDSLEAIHYLSHEKFTVNRNKSKYPLPADSVPRPDASVIAARLKKLDAKTPMALDYNADVQAYIDLYLVKARKVTSKIIGLTEIYNPLFEQMLDKYGIPLELKYLPIIESALNPKVKSWAGAMGLWQFMYPTGKMYGLEVSSYVDERCDPIKATEAACKYLKYLYSWYKDWNLALAAYNAGPGTINNAIRKSGGKTNYWDIFPYIPKETRGYVPAFIAANYFMNHYIDHNLVPYDTKMQYFAFDTVHVNKKLDLKVVSLVLNIPYQDLEYMNPVYKTNIVPGDDEVQHLFLPKNKVPQFIALADSIYNYNKVIQSDVNPNLAKQYVKVKKNESLKGVSLRIGYSVSDLKKWNNISGTYVKPGRWLVYYTSQKGAESENTASGDNKENTGNKETAQDNQQIKVKETPVKTPPVSPKYDSYTVRSGDTLYKIAERKRVSATSIKKVNPSVNWNRLQIGQKIKIPTG